MNFRRSNMGVPSTGNAREGLTFDEHMEESRLAQRQADKWLISGSLLIGTA